MSGLPELIKVGPFIYEVLTSQASWDELKREDKADSNTHWGYTDQNVSKIYLKPDVGPAMWKVILVHELFHAIIFVAGEIFEKKHKPEFFILHIAPLWLTVLQENLQLLDYLAEGVDDVDSTE